MQTIRESFMTIKEIAARAGVSIATVSHVINHTRYVSPELVDKIEAIIEESGYSEKIKKKVQKIRSGRSSQIVAVLPNIKSALYCDLCNQLQAYATSQGYQFYTAVSNNNLEEEQSILKNLVSSAKTIGIFLSPTSSNPSDYSFLYKSGIPFICVERYIDDDTTPRILFDYHAAFQSATSYFFESGHENVLFLVEKTDSLAKQEKITGYEKALLCANRTLSSSCVAEISLYQPYDVISLNIQKSINRYLPTAIVTGGNRLTMFLLKALRELGKDCPRDISIIGFDDMLWCELTAPPLSCIHRDICQMAELASQALFDRINHLPASPLARYADIHLILRDSTRMIDNGPLGEHAVSPDSISLSKEEKTLLKKGHYQVAVSFHYTGTAWAALHQKGIRDELEQYGIDIISTMDAHFDPALQSIQLESIKMQHPDAVIAIPSDDVETAPAFQELSRMTRLVFLSSVPQNFNRNDYVSCISVNERENGTNTGRMIGEYLKETPHARVGFIIHGAMFYGTTERDNYAEKILRESYPNIEITARKGFIQIENAYKVCLEMVTEHPDIQALYVSWDRPALLAIKALKALNRTDIAVFTTDLDFEIAQEMNHGFVKGLSTQRPYDQGKAAALAVAKSLVSNNVPKYIGVQPYVVHEKQLKRAWKDIFFEAMPEELR